MRALLATVLVVALAAPAYAKMRPPAPTTPWSTDVDWSKPPASAPDAAFVPPRPKRLKLKNGMNLLVVERHRLPLVSMDLVVKDAGSAQDPAGKSGLAGFTAEMLDEGAGGLSALELSARLDGLGARLDLATSFDAAHVRVSTLSRTLAPTLELVAKVITAPAFDEKESARVHDDWLTMLQLRPDQPRQVAALLLRGVLYGLQAAYGRPGDGYVAEFAAVTLADAKAFYAARWTPAAMTLVVVGDVDTAALVAQLDAAFATWTPKGKKAALVKAPAARVKGRLFLVDRPGAEQADVRVGIYGISLRDRRLPAADVLAKILGGSFTSRLNHRLREELGWTYGARAALQAGALIGPFVIGTALVTPHAVEGVNEILKLVGELSATDVPVAELAKARSNLVRDLPTRFATNTDAAESFGELVETGLPDDHFAGYVARVQKVTARDVRTLAKSLLPTAKLIVVVVGDASVVRAGLEQTLGPATLVTADLTPVAAAPPPAPR
jgi:zinc protease